MPAQLRSLVRDRVDAARTVLAEPNLRRLNLAYALVQLGAWAGFVAISLYAFRHGGAREVGVMTAVRLGPTVLVSPFAGILADRYPRHLVIAGLEVVRAGGQLLAAALIIEHASPGAVFVAVAASALAQTGLDPARAALLPVLARTPAQLTAANALEASVDGAALTLGPAIGGVLLGVTSVQVVLAVDGTAAAVAAALAFTIVEPTGLHQGVALGTVARQSLAGFRTIVGDRRLRLVVGVFAAQMLAFGLLLVFIVSVPLQELHRGASAVGWLNAAAGVGAIVGGLLTMTLKGSRLAPPLLTGMSLIALAYAALASLALLPVALLALALMNLGACYVDVATFTLLQRAVPEAMLARAFSVIGTITVASLLVGGVLAPVLISALGLRGALAVTAAGVAGCAAAGYSGLRAIDTSAPAEVDRIDLFAGLPLFRMLPVSVLERLASSARERRVPPGEEIITQGQPGDGYYVISDGEAEVLVDGVTVARLGRGDAFGEIALLTDRPRQATVRAVQRLRLEVLDRDVFIEVVGGNEESRRAGDALLRALP